VGTFARWPGIVDTLSTYASGWRYTGLGSSTAAPPGLVAMAGLTTALFGAAGLAHTLVVVLAFPVGAYGAYRFTRGITQEFAPSAVAGLAYALNPVPRNAIAAGRLGPLALPGAGDDPASLGFSFRPHLDLVDVLRFHSGPAGGGWAAWGFVAAGALALIVGRGRRFTWATRAWIMTLIGWALVWLPARFAPDVSVPAPEAALSLAALGLALAAGLGVSVFVEDVRGRSLGARQAVAVLAAAGFALGVLGFTADVGDGRWGAPDGDWPAALAFLQTERDSGGFRVLWVGDPSLLPLDPFVAGDG